MAKTKTSKKNTKPTMIIFDFTEVYNNMKAEQERDLAEAAAYAISHMDEKQKNNHTTKTSLWQKIKNLFKTKKVIYD